MSDSADQRRDFGARLLGAELLASRELAEGAGSLWDTLERGSRIHQQQLNWLISDYAGCIDELVKGRSPAAVPGAIGRLIGQRLNHITSGWQATGELLQDEIQPMLTAWQNFAAVTSDRRHR